MKRILFLIVMVLLPLQTVWAAAAPYCGHEARLAATKHFGHHEHQHEANPAAAAVAEAEISGAAQTQHPDCQSCHLGTIAPMATPVIQLVPLNPGAVQAEPGGPYHSHVPFGPERPDRIELTAAARHGSDVEFRPLNR